MDHLVEKRLKFSIGPHGKNVHNHHLGPSQRPETAAYGSPKARKAYIPREASFDYCP